MIASRVVTGALKSAEDTEPGPPIYTVESTNQAMAFAINRFDQIPISPNFSGDSSNIAARVLPLSSTTTRVAVSSTLAFLKKHVAPLVAKFLGVDDTKDVLAELDIKDVRNRARFKRVIVLLHIISHWQQYCENNWQRYWLPFYNNPVDIPANNEVPILHQPAVIHLEPEDQPVTSAYLHRTLQEFMTNVNTGITTGINTYHNTAPIDHDPDMFNMRGSLNAQASNITLLAASRKRPNEDTTYQGTVVDYSTRLYASEQNELSSPIAIRERIFNKKRIELRWACAIVKNQATGITLANSLTDTGELGMLFKETSHKEIPDAKLYAWLGYFHLKYPKLK